MYHNASVLVENPFHIQKQINRKVSAWSFHMINFKFLLQRTRKYNHTLWRTLLFIALLRWNQSDYTTNSHSSLIHFLFKCGLGGKEFPRNWASNTVTRQVSRTYCSYCCMVIKSRTSHAQVTHKSRICHLHRMNLAASAWKELCVRITTRSGTCCTNNMPLFKRLDNTRLYPAWKLRGRKQASITWSVSEENQHSNSCWDYLVGHEYAFRFSARGQLVLCGSARLHFDGWPADQYIAFVQVPAEHGSLYSPWLTLIKREEVLFSRGVP